MNPIVVKFGGSSLATAGQFEKVAAIIRENPGRRYVVASAPGKRLPISSPSCSCRSISRRTLPPSKHTCVLRRSATIWPAAANI